MILKDVIKSAFIDVVKAQYEAYLYSLELKANQDEDELFPIPTVKATDLTFQMQYAYVGDEVEQTATVFEKKKFLKDVKNATGVIVKEGIKALINYINQNKENKSSGWTTIQKGLAQKDLPDYVVKMIMNTLKNKYPLLVNQENEFDKKFYQTTVTSCFDNYVIDHFDLSPLALSPGDKQWLSYAIQPVLNEKSNQITNQIGKRISLKSNRDTTITVDSEVLKTLPQKAIQNLTLHVKLDDLDEIKVN